MRPSAVATTMAASMAPIMVPPGSLSASRIAMRTTDSATTASHWVPRERAPKRTAPSWSRAAKRCDSRSRRSGGRQATRLSRDARGSRNHAISGGPTGAVDAGGFLRRLLRGGSGSGSRHGVVSTWRGAGWCGPGRHVIRWPEQASVKANSAAPAIFCPWRYASSRVRLGVETRRQWADKALLRSTPALLGPFSIITLFAHDLAKSQKLKIRTAAWYPKAPRPSATPSQRSAAKYHPRDAWRFGCALASSRPKQSQQCSARMPDLLDEFVGAGQ